MKQTIEIEVLDGKKAIWKDGKVVFEDIKRQLPQTWKQFCKQNKIKEGEYFIYDNGIIMEADADERDADFNRNVLPSKQAAEQHLALMQLHQLRDCYRQGWKPNYEYGSINVNIEKQDNTPVIIEVIKREAFLSFPTRELAEQFLNNFKDLIEQAGDLI